ncbi:hypothetical protein PR048_004347 [Dryococelus australis]|uniref:Uncharacterized protein n=1 Tax=Dryococelus australis TaxID=614101 RepID=A0ABQ9I568_9NEOP|nr:hypothetical protein PR048_004347 [Dryococelus australis]
MCSGHGGYGLVCQSASVLPERRPPSGDGTRVSDDVAFTLDDFLAPPQHGIHRPLACSGGDVVTFPLRARFTIATQFFPLADTDGNCDEIAHTPEQHIIPSHTCTQDVDDVNNRCLNKHKGEDCLLEVTCGSNMSVATSAAKNSTGDDGVTWNQQEMFLSTKRDNLDLNPPMALTDTAASTFAKAGSTSTRPDLRRWTNGRVEVTRAELDTPMKGIQAGNNGQSNISRSLISWRSAPSSIYDTVYDPVFFLNNIRQYNTTFQMTSFRANYIKEGNFFYNLIGSLPPPPGGRNPQFLQIYFLFDQHQLNALSNINVELTAQIQTTLQKHNCYIQNFKHNLDNNPESDDLQIIIHADRRPANEHR